ncbi:uncharacterized protein IUM83_05527 [Phytophthora cinnamomi]|uniref:uncharacterized protein n=1 Tax=Phytophthora cinnamomi TaxID=4785 RepID=UPI003559D9CF|nr:hypothetical protein IUM83_05527 [Phytophthora cinnamomi]
MQAQLSPPSQAAVVCSAEDQPSTNDLSLSAWASGAAPASASADTDIQLARYTTQTDIGRKDESGTSTDIAERRRGSGVREKFHYYLPFVGWFKSFAAGVGEVVPVRVHVQKTKDGILKSVRVYEPARSAFRKLLSLHCPNIRIRSSQSNVCDLCTIYQTRMRQRATAEQTEELGQSCTSNAT